MDEFSSNTVRLMARNTDILENSLDEFSRICQLGLRVLGKKRRTFLTCNIEINESVTLYFLVYDSDISGGGNGIIKCDKKTGS